jgi:aminoglycoside/choline kinase family phosphotransferase/dTDP-glucose pyrophosphorylase
MKAMILAAGLGTRLLPLTEKKPKPLFPVLGQPLIHILIQRLKDSGCKAVIINTHHLAEMIDQFVKGIDYGIPVQTRYEPAILGTAGAIRNVKDFWNEKPLLVVNSDIFTNIDLGKVYRFHLSHEHPVTLVLHDCARFNNVWIDLKDHVKGFGHTSPCPPAGLEPGPVTDDTVAEQVTHRQLAYTGIQVLDREVLGYITEKTPGSIIDVYCKMIRAGFTPKAYVVRNHYWHDIGTLAGYQGATREALAKKALKKAAPGIEKGTLVWSKLKGDGSDRTWYRVSTTPALPSRLQQPSIILVDHGLPEGHDTCEADSFCAIGRHLYEKGISVPRIYAYDRQSGLIALEDLGDLDLQALVRRTSDPAKVFALYRAVIDTLVSMGIEGAKGFDPAFTYQTPHYDKDLILKKESEYFAREFLNGYLGLEMEAEDLKEEFELLAEMSLKTDYAGFLHRDFQSRNILVRGHRFFVIDFQGGRLGPLAYDLASLLIDPYVELPESIQKKLLTYYLNKLSDFVPVDPTAFFYVYKYCAINRNLQILGAFAFLSQVKGKKDFEAYIPPAVASLKALLKTTERSECPGLCKIVEGIYGSAPKK